MKKTALVLSGGGSRGGYEIGVWKALKKLGIKIDMVFGTSVGAINGALILMGSFKKSENLWQQLETDMIFDIDNSNITENMPEKMKNLLLNTAIGGFPAEDALAYAKEIVTKGGAGNSGLRRLLEIYLDETKIRKSTKLYGLVTTEYPSFDGHYMYIDDIPEGQLFDYILASASCFPAVQKCQINDKVFIDGGYRDNLPVEMALEKGATSIIAVDLQAAGFVRRGSVEKARQLTDEFHLIKSPVDLGNFLIFDKNNTAKLIQLGYFDTMKHWGKYDGVKYTFKKGIFTPHQLEGAEAAAEILGLDPICIYNKKSLTLMLSQVLEKITPDIETLSAKEVFNILRKEPEKLKMYPQLLTIIARDLKKNEASSFFLQSTVFKLLEDEVQAANFLINEGLI